MKRFSSTLLLLLPVTVVVFPPGGTSALAGVPRRVHDAVRDKFVPAPASGQQTGGVIGARIATNLERRLLIDLDEAALLSGYRKRDNKNRYVGEHAGKFIESATNTWLLTRDERLKAKLDRVVQGLIATQMPDGYLGTYNEDGRWLSWDVWAHKYNLVGLLAYYEATGDEGALAACRKMGDLLARVFGDRPGQRDIVNAGEHMGTAATSVLEPVCELYRFTGEKRYLDFARYIVRSYDQPHGPKIIRSLLDTGSLYKTASAKSYEIISNLVGLADLYRLTGDETFLKPVLAAWDDITTRRMYITGTVSAGEHFLDDHDLPAGGPAHMGEGCATFSWMQMNWQLLRLTGEAKYADEIERTVYNHLLGAQNAQDGRICYYMPMDGRKPFDRNMTCCGSSIPRGIAMIPRLAWGSLNGGILVSLYLNGRASVKAGPVSVGLQSETSFPSGGKVTLTVSPAKTAMFPLYLRVPYWTDSFLARVNGTAHIGKPGTLLPITRAWKKGDRVEIEMEMTTRALGGGQTYPNSIALQRGPQVLSLEEELNPDVPVPTLAALAGAVLKEGPRQGRPSYVANGLICAGEPGAEAKKTRQDLALVPYMDATRMRTWLLKPDALPSGRLSLAAFGKESASRNGDSDGSISDERPDTYRRTFNWEKPAEDWYAVELRRPALVVRIVYRHGAIDFRGGWFDTSAGKPRVQVKREGAVEWETVATLDSYPETNAKDQPALLNGQAFEVRLAQQVRAAAIRVAGKPASGRKGGQAYSSCAELSAYEN